MAKTDDYCFLNCEDGIYFGRPLKNGAISKDARKVSDEELVEVFGEVLRRRCLQNCSNILQVHNADGTLAFEAKIHLSPTED